MDNVNTVVIGVVVVAAMVVGLFGYDSKPQTIEAGYRAYIQNRLAYDCEKSGGVPLNQGDTIVCTHYIKPNFPPTQSATGPNSPNISGNGNVVGR